MLVKTLLSGAAKLFFALAVLFGCLGGGVWLSIPLSAIAGLYDIPLKEHLETIIVGLVLLIAAALFGAAAYWCYTKTDKIPSSLQGR